MNIKTHLHANYPRQSFVGGEWIATKNLTSWRQFMGLLVLCFRSGARQILLLICPLLVSATLRGEYLGPVPYLADGGGIQASLMAPNGEIFLIARSAAYDSTARSYTAPRNSQGELIEFHESGETGWKALSKTGRFAVYSIEQSTLFPNSKIFRWDRSTGTVMEVSRAPNGTYLPSTATDAAVSEDGSTVAFLSGLQGDLQLTLWRDGEGATQKTPAAVGTLQARRVQHIAMTPDGNSIFIYCSLVSPQNPNGAQTPALLKYNRLTNQFTILRSGPEYAIHNLNGVSDDGRLLCFVTPRALLPTDTNSVDDIYVLDTSSDTLRRVNVSSSGAQANGHSGRGAQISGNGRYVAFESDATNLIAADFNGKRDIFRHDLGNGQTRKLSTLNDGSSVADGASLSQGFGFAPRQFVSTDGSRVVFRIDFLSGSRIWDENGVVPTAPVPRSPQPGLSGGSLKQLPFGDTQTLHKALDGGRFVHTTAFFGSGGSGFHRDAIQDATTGMFEYVDVASGTATTLPITPGNRFVIFASAANLVPADTNGKVDLYLRDRQLNTTTKLTQALDGS